MGWILKCKTKKEYRKVSRAILGKYAKRITPSVYFVNNRSVLNAINSELNWCYEQGIPVFVSCEESDDFDFFIG